MSNRIRRITPPRIDARVSFAGQNLALLYLNTEAARDWVRDNVEDTAQFFGGALVVEPRYIGNLVDGLTAAGFSVA
jgi:hypothetical protein